MTIDELAGRLVRHVHGPMHQVRACCQRPNGRGRIANYGDLETLRIPAR